MVAPLLVRVRLEDGGSAVITPQQISDALAELLASGDVKEGPPGLYMITAKGMARVQRMLDRGMKDVNLMKGDDPEGAT